MESISIVRLFPRTVQALAFKLWFSCPAQLQEWFCQAPSSNVPLLPVSGLLLGPKALKHRVSLCVGFKDLGLYSGRCCAGAKQWLQDCASRP